MTENFNCENGLGHTSVTVTPIKKNTGTIYKIMSDNFDKIYIGSTTQPLNRRLSAHKYMYKRYLKNNKNSKCTSFMILEKEGNINIETIEVIEFDDKKTLDERERHYINLHYNESVNTSGKPVIHTIANNDYIQYQRNYYKNNREHLLNRLNSKTICEVCKGVYSYVYKNKHFQTKKHMLAKSSINNEPIKLDDDLMNKIRNIVHDEINKKTLIEILNNNEKSSDNILVNALEIPSDT